LLKNSLSLVVRMSDHPADTSTENKESPKNNYRCLELAVPLLSFGGAFLAVLFYISGTPVDYRATILGCMFASWVLAYLAWIRPRKDIVALSTPIYSFIFFAVPTDLFSTLVLELLYATSLTLLLVRLKYRFGEPGISLSDRKDLAEPLRTYVAHTQATCTGITPETAHQAALVFVRFAEGNYGEAVRVAGGAAGQMEAAGETCIILAFRIVKEHASILDTSSPRPQTFLTFAPDDTGQLAKTGPVSGGEMEFDMVLDNALLLLYSVAWTASERDRAHLLVCQPFAQKLLSEV
jgi:hypothetical protein